MSIFETQKKKEKTAIFKGKEEVLSHVHFSATILVCTEGKDLKQRKLPFKLQKLLQSSISLQQSSRENRKQTQNPGLFFFFLFFMTSFYAKLGETCHLCEKEISKSFK